MKHCLHIPPTSPVRTRGAWLGFTLALLAGATLDT